jgi:hypothetical protein
MPDRRRRWAESRHFTNLWVVISLKFKVLLDHLVGAGEEQGRNLESERRLIRSPQAAFFFRYSPRLPGFGAAASTRSAMSSTDKSRSERPAAMAGETAHCLVAPRNVRMGPAPPKRSAALRREPAGATNVPSGHGSRQPCRGEGCRFNFQTDALPKISHPTSSAAICLTSTIR